MSGGGKVAVANVKAKTTPSAVETPQQQPAVTTTNPAAAQQITNVFVLISVLVLGMYAHAVCMHFSVDGPLWEAFAWSAGEAPLFLVPLWAILSMRADFISIYAEERSNGTAGDSSDFFKDLLGHDIV